MDLRDSLDVLEARVIFHLSGIELLIDQPVDLSLHFPYRMSMMQKKYIKRRVGSVCWGVYVYRMCLLTTLQSPL